MRWYKNLPPYWKSAAAWTLLAGVAVMAAFWVFSGNITVLPYGFVVGLVAGFSSHHYAWRAGKRDDDQEREQGDR